MRLASADGDVEIEPDTVSALRLKYRGVDVETELAKMHLWLLSNKARRPRNLMRFVETWLGKQRPKPASVVKVERKRGFFGELFGDRNAIDGVAERVDRPAVSAVCGGVREPLVLEFRRRADGGS